MGGLEACVSIGFRFGCLQAACRLGNPGYSIPEPSPAGVAFRSLQAGARSGLRDPARRGADPRHRPCSSQVSEAGGKHLPCPNVRSEIPTPKECPTMATSTMNVKPLAGRILVRRLEEQEEKRGG